MPTYEDSQLERAYCQYLESPRAVETAVVMCRALHDSGLRGERARLEQYLERGEGDALGGVGDVWEGRRCSIGSRLPEGSQPGDLWFDTVELTTMVLMASPQDCWIAAHPVYVWQFRSFLRLVHVGRKIIEFEAAVDVFERQRFAGMDPMAFVTDVYHDEALAYAYWFGKLLGGKFQLRAARTALSSAEFSRVLPRGMRLWHYGAYDGSEFTRVAVGGDTLDRSQFAEEKRFESGQTQSLVDRMLFDEWERRGDIGFSTCVPAREMVETTPRHTIFFELLNHAVR